MLISFPRPTQMLHFGRFALPSEKQGSVKRDLIRKSRDQRSHALTPGLSQLATSFIAYQAESFPNRRLRTIPGTPFFFTIAAPETLREHFRKATFFYTLSVIMLTSWMFPVILCTTVTADCSATSFIPYRNRELHILYFGHTNPQHQSFTQGCPARKTKEVIQPQVPLRLPCYDFSPVADPRFDSANEAPPRQEPASVKRRAVCARSRDVFTARC